MSLVCNLATGFEVKMSKPGVKRQYNAPTRIVLVQFQKDAWSSGQHNYLKKENVFNHPWHTHDHDVALFV